MFYYLLELVPTHYFFPPKFCFPIVKTFLFAKFVSSSKIFLLGPQNQSIKEVWKNWIWAVFLIRGFIFSTNIGEATVCCCQTWLAVSFSRSASPLSFSPSVFVAWCSVRTLNLVGDTEEHQPPFHWSWPLSSGLGTREAWSQNTRKGREGSETSPQLFLRPVLSLHIRTAPRLG